MPSKNKKRKSKKKPDLSKIRTLDSFFVDEPIRRDEFGFLDALSGEEVEGFFAAFDIDSPIETIG